MTNFNNRDLVADVLETIPTEYLFETNLERIDAILTNPNADGLYDSEQLEYLTTVLYALVGGLVLRIEKLEAQGG
jgi:hypothetical protein